MQQYPNMQQPMQMQQYPNMQMQQPMMQPMVAQPMGIQPMGIGTKILYGCIIVICLLIVYYMVYGTLPFGLMDIINSATDKTASATDKTPSAPDKTAAAPPAVPRPPPAVPAAPPAVPRPPPVAPPAAPAGSTTMLPSSSTNAVVNTINTANTATNPTGPSFLGCYSSGPKSHNNSRIATDHTHGIANVTECNAAAKAAGKNYFGMSYWQGGGYDATGTKNIGDANCVWASDNLDLAALTKYTGTPGGPTGRTNAPGCPADGPYTNECISNDTVNACAINLGTDVPPNSGKLGGGWINALYKTF